MERWLERFAAANFRRSADTAHDLKTPLNVAVLNLELLRMRLARLGAGDDEKVREHLVAIETELRRMARIFDAFFLLSTPPKEDEPTGVDAASMAGEAAAAAGLELHGGELAPVRAHPERLREMFRLFFAATLRHFRSEEISSELRVEDGQFDLSVSGRSADELEMEKAFKFYYTDREGNPDLSLAVARLIAETYGGELTSKENGDRLGFRLALPLGEK